MMVGPHRRLNLLSGEWVLVSPQRLERPWLGRVEVAAHPTRPRYDSGCYLCPGNERANGERNPNYSSCFTFTNDFPALLPDAQLTEREGATLLQRADVRGTCRVVCFSPRHDLTLAEMSVPEIGAVIDVWADESAALGRDYAWVQVFENKGELMGCSNPHPHGQIWALDVVPSEPAREDRSQRTHHERTGRALLLDYAEAELADGRRLVVANDDWLAVVPYWAVWPFETLVLPRRHVLQLSDLTAGERVQLAELWKRLLVKYDNLFTTSFPYSMGWHGAPCHADDAQHWQLHAHVLPPLLRSATVKKFMVGYELLGEPQRDLTPEQAAARLRAASEIHYLASAGVS